MNPRIGIIDSGVSWLNQPHAEFGACSLQVPGQPQRGGGASLACARLTGFAARLLAAQWIAPCKLAHVLRGQASFIGPERRHS
ncbi:hypothetical protein [Pseudomonas sp. R5(2019)]|uniref:hypothetical protein n=1 Tax=Pseudomonas sp. R5(2019) TaxID=2697566 RepID=UPI00141233D9|nr:hypothetical protein [Pseudomonas sp. R5(2019)]NBA94796.1 hypothetical protein [Pseudomonas sp. R5(2019)]